MGCKLKLLARNEKRKDLKSVELLENGGMVLRRRFLLIAIAALAVSALVLGLVINQELISKHMYPEDALHETANLSVRGVVTTIEQNHKTQGMIISSYHIFRLYIQLNITEVVWTNEGYLVSSTDNNTVLGSNRISVGYDSLDNPQLITGQEIECKGFYFGATDSPYSFILTVAPSVNESYLKPQI
jgi:hypothetical protein